MRSPRLAQKAPVMQATMDQPLAKSDTIFFCIFINSGYVFFAIFDLDFIVFAAESVDLQPW